jgi:glycosyltransferase involved in cell wall biosynthesis
MKINLISPITPQTSYGITGLNLVTSLCEVGYEVALFPIGQPSIDPGCPWQKQPIQESLKRGQLSYDVNAPCVRLFHQFSLSEFVGKGPHIGFPIFELNRFTEHEKAQLSRCDHLITCSEWGKNIIESEIEDWSDSKCEMMCSVVPLGHDPRVYNTENIKKPDTTTFLHISKTEVRKSSKEIVESFKKAFTPNDSVRLLLAWHNLFESEQERQEWVRFATSGPMGHKIEVLPRFESCVQVASVIKSADCLVSMSKAEGWNMGNLEAMACGLPVITTINSGQSEFCNDRNCLVIETDELTIALDGKWFLGKGFEGTPGQWHKIGQPQIDRLVTYLRMVHEFKQTGSLKINSAGVETAESFTWTNSAKKLIQVLESL